MKFTMEDLKPNRSWPFKSMKVNEVVSYSWKEDAELALDAFKTAQIYSSQNQRGIKLMCRCIKKDGIKYTVIGRVE